MIAAHAELELEPDPDRHVRALSGRDSGMDAAK
jgi:hypothetical protein